MSKHDDYDDFDAPWFHLYNDPLYYGPPAEGELKRLPGAVFSVGVYVVLGLFGLAFVLMALAGAIPKGGALFIFFLLGSGLWLSRRRARQKAGE